jgi:hypothetical protein
VHAKLNNLSGDRVDWLWWFGNILVEVANNHEDHDGEKGCEKSGQRVVGTTILVHTDETLCQKSNEIHPSDRRGKRKTTNDRRQ